jgi:predicted nucleic acid-binding protein
MEVDRPHYLVDKSALARMRNPSVAEVLAPLLSGGEIAVCGVLQLEVLFSARSHADFVATREELRGYPHLSIQQVDFDRAATVMELLARRGQHRAAGLPDLLTAAVAERYGVTVLHYDADYDGVQAVTNQPMRWVVPRGSVP